MGVHVGPVLVVLARGEDLVADEADEAGGLVGEVGVDGVLVQGEDVDVGQAQGVAAALQTRD